MVAAYQESLDISRRLAAQDQGNAEAQRDLSVSLNKVGDVKLQGGDRAGRSPPTRRVSTFAASSRRRTKATCRRKPIWSSASIRVSTADPSQARAALTEALAILEKLEQEQKLAASQKNWPNVLRAAPSKLP